ncbi:GNAT family N-acetyltransferase [Tissierella sp. MSJ-40]|uniref:GNAT family N-acetyltransferase n=1 Tax=Tissierella simiarum TaxID=2841534 RepID=A0ABS6E9L3_9FIRM|nr:GNAT family N-acetyltransferase [Tissierella simiarum]MBU5439618.1 GNAT family N-acetyltransferase [Tissierella simiarum]
MEYRRLNVNDFNKVIEMVKDFRSIETVAEKAKKFLKNSQNYLVVCLDHNERVIGFVLGYELNRYDDKNNMMYIHEVGILEEYRRMGIGKELMNQMKMICDTRELSKMFLITNKSNIPAVNLYESSGAKCTEDDNIVYWYENRI